MSVIKLGELLQMHRIEIIEWLYENDRKTGLELSEEIKKLDASVKVIYTECRSSNEVLSRLAQIHRETTTTNIPLLHIESHGFGRGEEDVGGIAGRGLKGDEELSWKAIWPLLRIINAASGFNLTIASAACYGDAVTFGVLDSLVVSDTQIVVQSIAFMAALGPVKSIFDDDLFEAFRVFYSALFRGARMEDAIEAANGASEKCGLDWLSSYQLAQEMISGSIKDNGHVHINTEKVIQGMFWHSRFPDNRKRFPILLERDDGSSSKRHDVKRES